jgi:hypothetical protein
MTPSRLIAEWRMRALGCAAMHLHPQAKILATCADELDAALRDPSDIEQALTDAGITLTHGTLRWVFRPNQLEVSSGGGSERQRLAGLLTQVSHLIHQLARERDDLLVGERGTPAEPPPQLKRCAYCGTTTERHFTTCPCFPSPPAKEQP